MSKTNSKFKVLSNVQHYLERDYQMLKAIKESDLDNKYFRKQYFNELALYCGVSPSTISQMHARNLHASYLLAIKISEFINVPVEKIWQVVEKENE